MKNILVIFILLLSANVSLALDGEECQRQFRLKGSINAPFTNITPNAWNNKILPEIWVDKGGHFLARMKESNRGGAAGLFTPSDLESFVLGGKIFDEGRPNRYIIKRVEGRAYHVIFEVNKVSRKCELVTFFINNP